MKRCSMCGVEKPHGDYYKDKRATDGLYSCCKPCHYTKTERQRRNNPEKVRAEDRARRARDPEKYREKDRQWCRTNPEADRAKKQRHHERHPDARSKSWKKYYEANRERMLERRARYREQFPLKVKAQRDPVKSHIYSERRRAQKLNAYVADVYESDIILRDEGRCGICKEPVMGPHEIDHTVPLSRGGTHEPANVRLTHKTCNRRKHARLDYAA